MRVKRQHGIRAAHDALVKAETQATRHKDRLRTRKRTAQTGEAGGGACVSLRSGRGSAVRKQKSSGNGTSQRQGTTLQPAITGHRAFLSHARAPIAEPHIVRSLDSVALRPMTLEEAVKEAEFRDRDVFVFRDNEGNVKVLHRKRDGKMELIEAP